MLTLYWVNDIFDALCVKNLHLCISHHFPILLLNSFPKIHKKRKEVYHEYD